MAKKKTSRVSPPITKTDIKYVMYGDLNNGDAFLMNGSLWIKMDVCDQEALNLDTGVDMNCLCDVIIEPVDITITWKKKQYTI